MDVCRNSIHLLQRFYHWGEYLLPVFKGGVSPTTKYNPE
jgi:hypothetical protein